jgi:hypothetical protein
MGWKSTKTISRQNIEKKIETEIYCIEKLSDDTLCVILEILGADKETEIYAGHNYTIEDE